MSFGVWSYLGAKVSETPSGREEEDRSLEGKFFRGVSNTGGEREKRFIMEF